MLRITANRICFTMSFTAQPHSATHTLSQWVNLSELHATLGPGLAPLGDFSGAPGSAHKLAVIASAARQSSIFLFIVRARSRQDKVGRKRSALSLQPT
jgi:hypothetical protein